jgi:acyl transferase domain-containing protein
LSTPSGEAQVEVIQEALHHAQLSPNDISFVESAGNGAPLGDSIEMESILKVSVFHFYLFFGQKSWYFLE